MYLSVLQNEVRNVGSNKLAGKTVLVIYLSNNERYYLQLIHSLLDLFLVFEI